MFDCCSILKSQGNFEKKCPPSQNCSSTPNLVLTDQFQSIGCHLLARLLPRRPSLTWVVLNQNRNSRCDVVYELTNASGQTKTTLPLSVGPRSRTVYPTRTQAGGPFVSVKVVSVTCRIIQCNCVTQGLVVVPPIPSLTQSNTFPLGSCGASVTVSQIQIGSSTNLNFELRTDSNCAGDFNFVFVFTSGEQLVVDRSLNVNTTDFLQIATTVTADYQSVTLNYRARF